MYKIPAVVAGSFGCSVYGGYKILRHIKSCNEVHKKSSKRTNEGSRNSKGGIGLIVGYGVGGSIIVGGTVLILVFWWRKRTRRGKKEDDAPDDSMDDEFEHGMGPRRLSYGELVQATNNFAQNEGSQNSKGCSQSQPSSSSSSKPPQSSSENPNHRTHILLDLNFSPIKEEENYDPLSSSAKTCPSSYNPPTSPSVSIPPSSSPSPSLSSTKAPLSSSDLSQKSSPTPATSSSKPPQSSSEPLSFSTKTSPSSFKPSTSSSKQSSSSPKPATSPSVSIPPSSSPSPSLSSTKAPLSSSNLSQKSSPTPATSSSKPPQSSSEPLSFSTKTSPSSFKPPTSYSKQSSSSPKPATSPSVSIPPSSSPNPSLSSTKAPLSSSDLSQKSSPTPATSSSKAPQSSSEPLSFSTKTSPSSFTPPTSSSKQSSSSPKPATSPSVSIPPSSSPSPSLSSIKAPLSSSNLSKSSPTPATSSSKPPQSSSEPLSFSTKTSPSSFKPPTSSSKQSLSSPKPATSSSSSPSLSSWPKPTTPSKPSPSSSGLNPLPSFKATLSPAFSDSNDQQMIWLELGTSPTYKIPKVIEDLIKKDIVPRVLKMPLSPSTYKDYFAALLYAEDFYADEKWSDFQLENVTLELREGTIYKKSDKNIYINESGEKDDKIFVAFEIENVPEKRPFLLSRDFVFARPSGRKVEPFQGILNRVEESTRVLVEFGEDFHSQHYSTREYDVSFSFNRVSLKRAHEAIAAASDSIFQNFIFPNNLSRKNIPTSPHPLSYHHYLDEDQKSAVIRILSFQGPPAYLVQGPLCVKQNVLSRTGLVVREAVLQICRTSPKSRILICAPLNKTCDVLMKSLKQEIPESDMFRANAAFREIDGVPIDILPYCPYERECFVCPPLQELQKFRVILSTFISSFRLHKEGITAGHFTHIFLVDSSSATEPETMVALANLADEKTNVVVTGAPRNCSGLVRSDMARRNGLRISYFERLCESNPYRSLEPSFITDMGDY